MQALRSISYYLIYLLPLLVLAGCSVGKQGGVYGSHTGTNQNDYTLHDKITSSGQGRYSQKIDSLPTNPTDVSKVADAVPRSEPKSRGGNASSYVVFGQTYRVLNSSRGFTQTGTASWYGNKFHGHLTSNGEVYDMYTMSAAHTRLPLPTYVKVTNLDNNRQVIVRVNDRGPFVGNRIIDLSYAAAYRLDMVKTGTARVKVEAIDPVQWQAQQAKRQPPLLASNASQNNVFLQVAALGNAQAAERLQHRVRKLTQAPVRVISVQGKKPLYRVQVGPLQGHSVQATIQKLEATDLGRPLMVRN